jgi:hypothetical protein
MPDNVSLPPQVTPRRQETSPEIGQPAFTEVDGWVAFTSWSNNSGQPVSSFSTTWTVPPAPAIAGNQTIFLFNGIQNSTMIYQPVLQWGSSAAGGGQYWAIASWYADGQNGHVFHSDLVQVNVGTSLTGVMTLVRSYQSPTGGRLFDYHCTFTGYTHTVLDIQGVEELTWLCETLEAYGITDCSQFPYTNSTSFTAINLQTGTATPNLAWAANTPHAECGELAAVVSNAAAGGEVDIWYKFAVTIDGPHQVEPGEEYTLTAVALGPGQFTYRWNTNPVQTTQSITRTAGQRGTTQYRVDVTDVTHNRTAYAQLFVRVMSPSPS